MKRTPIRRRSPQRRADDAAFRVAADVVRARSDGMCELRTPVCVGRAVHVHHVLPRAATRGLPPSERHRPDLMAATCRPCHDHAHSHPDEAYAAGWLIRRTAP